MCKWDVVIWVNRDGWLTLLIHQTISVDSMEMFLFQIYLNAWEKFGGRKFFNKNTSFVKKILSYFFNSLHTYIVYVEI